MFLTLCNLAGAIADLMVDNEGEHEHHHLLLNQTKFSGNVAHLSRPSILVNYLSSIQVCCISSYQKCFSRDDLLNTDSVCIFKEDKGILGTFAGTLDVLPRNIHNYTSGEFLPAVQVKLIDVFGHIVPISARFIVRLRNTSSADLILPAAVSRLFTGTFNLTNLKLRGHPGKHRIEFIVKTREGNIYTVNNSIAVHIPDCGIGEFVEKKSKRCRPCSNGLYSFDVRKHRCKLCKPNAQCTGKTLVPVDGYWHNDSQSDIIHRCLSEKSCSYSGRIAALVRISEKHLDSGITWNSGYPLCNKVKSA